MDESLFVDFSDFDEQLPKINKTGYDKEYDTTTTEFYRVMRQRKMNVIMHDDNDFDPEKSFKFPYTWDPYTGKRCEEDPHGALYFHPDDLIHYFDVKKLDNLWIEPTDESGGYYAGYYGEAMGSGGNINIVGRGIYPELYLFRLPISDCYLPPNNDMSIITMGPKLTSDEINEIEMLATKHFKNNYYNKYHKQRPSLTEMKLLYDQAISKNPDVASIKTSKPFDMNYAYNLANRNAVDQLKKI